ncbi:MAG: hypothetical protein LWX56_00875 [Ignavibacteria bacterium]|nr:hypothetical protein [Ignavibacteria bacterium]
MKQYTTSAIITGIITVVVIVMVIVSNQLWSGTTFYQMSLTGAHLLKAETYLRFASLQANGKQEISAAEIRNRLLHHPYIKDVIVLTNKPGTATIQIEEKRVLARLFTNSHEALIAENGEVINLLSGTTNPDVPIVSGVLGDENGRLTAEEKQKVSSAFKFVRGALIEPEVLEKKLSELVIKKNGTMIVTLSGFRPFFIIDEKNIERQTAYMYSLVKAQNNYSALIGNASYVDVRFNKKIFVGS